MLFPSDVDHWFKANVPNVLKNLNLACYSSCANCSIRHSVKYFKGTLSPQLRPIWYLSSLPVGSKCGIAQIHQALTRLSIKILHCLHCNGVQSTFFLFLNSKKRKIKTASQKCFIVFACESQYGEHSWIYIFSVSDHFMYRKLIHGHTHAIPICNNLQSFVSYNSTLGRLLNIF